MLYFSWTQISYCCSPKIWGSRNAMKHGWDYTRLSQEDDSLLREITIALEPRMITGRDWEIDRLYYPLWRSNMTYETKNITFHMIRVKVSNDSRCSRTLPMNVAIESAHCGCERISWKDWTRSKRCGKHGQIWSKAEHCIILWYSNSRTCLGQSVHSWLLSSLVPQWHVSHCSVT